jgi:glycyl-tRNA synthetase
MTKEKQTTMDEIVAFAKRRGFVYPSSEIYGGFSGVYDYGPYGVELANNIKQAWWKAMVQMHENIVGLDSSIFMHPDVWKASGHVDGFSDPLTECKACNTRIRVDHMLEAIGVQADEKMSEEEINALMQEHIEKLKCPKCGKNDFAPAKHFNLLAQSNLGNFSGDWANNPTYLRGETCQGIYINFKNVVDTVRQKVPFGIAQIGKAFRNEISARQFIFRKREFEQMEMQMFVHPSEMMEVYELWREKRMAFWKNLGFTDENIKWHEHENLVFYAKAAWDIEFNFPFGFAELEGVHARGDYDLSQHTTHSKTDLSYRDPVTNEVFTPNVVETSVGVDRAFLAVLTQAYVVEEMDGKERTVLKLPKELAPIKVAVFPLLKNKPELVAKAREVFAMLAPEMMCEFDDNGNVGKRYRRQDEIGTPHCVTIDFETLANHQMDECVVR